MATTKETVRCNVIQNKKLVHLQSELQKKFLLKMDCCNGKSQLRLINCDGTLRKNGNISFSLMDQPLSEKGAIATTWAHDHHNLMVMGNTIEDILLAQNELLAMQGGYLVASDQQVMATCPYQLVGFYRKHRLNN